VAQGKFMLNKVADCWNPDVILIDGVTYPDRVIRLRGVPLSA